MHMQKGQKQAVSFLGGGGAQRGREKKRDKNKMTQVRSGLICEAWAEEG